MKLKNTMQEQYAVIGNPIAHSKSPIIHSLYAIQTEQHKLIYTSLCFGLDSFHEELDGFISNGGLGANVTVPFKRDAWKACDKLSEGAALAGAVNTLSFSDGLVYGDNTDGVGLINDLQVNHLFSIKDKKVLIIGAGGAVRGILKPLIDAQPASITIANRTVSKAADLAAIFSDYFSIVPSSFESLSGSYDLIINGTSASLSNELPPVKDSLVSPDTVLYDMMYSKTLTVFNQWGANLGAASTIDGLGMLVGQAAQSFYIWRGVMPDTKSVIEYLRNTL